MSVFIPELYAARQVREVEARAVTVPDPAPTPAPCGLCGGTQFRPWTHANGRTYKRPCTRCNKDYYTRGGK